MTQEEDIKITLLIDEMRKKAGADSVPDITETEKLAAWCQKIGAGLYTQMQQHPVTAPVRGMPPALMPSAAAASVLGTVNPKSTAVDIAQASVAQNEPQVDPRPWSQGVDQEYLDQLLAVGKDPATGLPVSQIAAAGPRSLELQQKLRTPEGVVLNKGPQGPVTYQHPEAGGALAMVPPPPPPTDTENLLKFLTGHQAEIASGLVGAGTGRVSQPEHPEAGMFGGIAGGVGGRLLYQKILEHLPTLVGGSLGTTAQTIMNYGVGPALTLAGSMLGASGASKLVNKKKPQADPIKQRQLELYRNLAQAAGRRVA